MKPVHVGMNTYRYGHVMLFNADSPEEAQMYLNGYMNMITANLMRKVLCHFQSQE